MKNKLLAKAYHQAGNAVYLLQIGIIPEKIEIHSGGGNISINDDIKDTFVYDLISLAGTVSQHIYIGDCAKMIRRVEDGLIPPGADEDFDKLNEKNPQKITQKMKLLLEFFLENWQCVHVLAIELAQRLKIDKKNILEISKKADFFQW